MEKKKRNIIYNCLLIICAFTILWIYSRINNNYYVVDLDKIKFDVEDIEIGDKTIKQGFITERLIGVGVYLRRDENAEKGSVIIELGNADTETIIAQKSVDIVDLPLEFEAPQTIISENGV